MDKKFLKYGSVAIIAIVVLNMMAFALKFVSTLIFWGVIAAAAVYAYKVLPRLKK